MPKSAYTTKPSMNAAQLEALKAGASMEEVLALGDTPATDPVAEDPAKAADPAKTATMSIEDARAKIAELEAGAVALTEQLTTAQTALATAQAGATDTSAKLEAAENQIKAFAAVVTPYVSRMAVAMGLNVATANLTPAEILAKHDLLATDFKASFKPGGVAKSAASTQEAAAKQIANERIMADAKNFSL